MSNNTWKEFEILTKEIQEDLSPFAKIRVDRRIRGESGVLNQCDVIVESKNRKLPFLCVIECKDYDKKIGISFIREFKSLLDDLNANSGIFVTTIGYTKPAVTFAEYHNIELRTLFDSKKVKWAKHAIIPMKLNYIIVQSYNIQMRSYLDDSVIHTLSRENKDTIERKYNYLNNIINMGQIVTKLWRDIEFSGNDEIHITSRNRGIIDINTGLEVYCDMKITTKLEHRVYMLSIEEGRGFISKNDFLSKEFMTSFIGLDPNKLYEDSLPDRSKVNSLFQLRITERIVDDSNYILPKGIQFEKKEGKINVHKQW